MNDLDRKIAELKGWRLFKPGETTPADHSEWSESKAAWKPEAAADWSTSDSKALELVDEIPECHFVLERGLSPEVDAEAWEWEWRAGFMLGGSCHLVVAPTRPEAICRAYIAAREWMKEKGK